MFSTKSEYGVRVMVQLARRRGPGPVPLAEIAHAENLPLPYLEQLVSRLRRAGLVSSTRGAHGGYELGRDPAEITMAEVVHALEETIVPVQCVSELGAGRMLCNHETRRLRELRHEAFVDPRPGRHRARARADHSRGAGELRRTRRRARRSHTAHRPPRVRACGRPPHEHRRSEPPQWLI